MNLTGGNTLPNIGKRNRQIVILAGGLALALGVGAFAGVFEREGSPATTAVSQPAAAQLPAGPAIAPVSRAGEAPSEMVYILVGSQEAAASVEGLENQDTIVEVVVLETAGQEAEFTSMINLAAPELTAANANLRIVDLREAGPAVEAAKVEAASDLPTVYVVATPEEQAQLEQRISESGESGSIYVIEQGTLQGDHLYNALVGEQLEFGNFDVVDLR